jgi:hypothetical protein
MPRIPLLGLGQLARSNFVTANSIQNLAVESRPQGEKSILVAFSTPGLRLFADFGPMPVRGGIAFEELDVCFVVHLGNLYEVNNVGVATARGMLLTTQGRIGMSHNTAQVMIVDGTAGYIYNTVTHAFAQITDPDFPANPATVTYLGRRFVVSIQDSSRFQVSDIDDGLSWDALNFANAEVSPDQIVRAYASNGQLILPGYLVTEFWGNSGTADFPFSQLQGTANEWGLAARYSIARFDNTFCMLVQNRMGQVMIGKMNGYLPEKISSQDMDFVINQYAVTTDASALSYMCNGHPMYQINFPSVPASWLYDGSQNPGQWSKVKSFGIARHLAEFGFTLLGQQIVGDFSTGRLHRLDCNALTDNGASIEREIVSETVANPGLEYLQADCLRIDMEVGSGTATGQGSNPQIGLSVSRDNGKTWGAQMWKTMGAIGQFRTRVEWRRLGTARAFTFKLTCTDPVPFVVVSATLNPESD